MQIKIIAVAYDRPIQLRMLIDCFIIQTDPRWELSIVYDGPAPEKILDIITPYIEGKYKDERIHFYQSEERYQKYGHPNRRSMLQSIKCDPKDFILMQNDDNYLVPKTIEFIQSVIKPNTGIVYWDAVHSHMGYDVHISEMKENFIDMAAFVVRADVAKFTGFNSDHFSADGRYAEECAGTCRSKGLQIVKIKKPLLIHN